MRAIRRKIRSEMKISPEAGFPRMGPVHYLTHLQDLHATLAPKVYLEIGTESGASLSFAGCVAFAVDPAFDLQADVSRNKPELHQFQGTSDDFFASRMVERLGYQVDFAFLDGMHHFGFSLRDFINTERLMAPGGVITMHDCIPISHLSAEREWDHEKTIHWVGDVWKLLPILRRYRPDLKVEVLDLVPTALVMVSQLDPTSKVLSEAYDAILADFRELTLAVFGIETLVSLCDFVRITPKEPAPAFVAKQVSVVGNIWIDPGQAADRPLSIAIKTNVPNHSENDSWGDFHFAKGLAKGFLASGHRVRIDARPDWNSDGGSADVDLVLHGDKNWTARDGVPDIQWVLYPGLRTTSDLISQLTRADHACVASLDALADAGLRSVTRLMQGFDPDLMFTDGSARSEDIVFVGNCHRRFKSGRPSVKLAVAAGLRVRLWGKKWKGLPAYKYHEGDYFPNAELGTLYRRSKIVLCDHMHSMLDNGYISKRIFDALACGAAVISDKVVGLPEEFAPYVHLCATVDELQAAVALILAEGPERIEQRRRFALSMRDRHSLHQRADAILDICRLVVPAPATTDS